MRKLLKRLRQALKNNANIDKIVSEYEELDNLLEQRRKILTKGILSKDDKKFLAKTEKQMNTLNWTDVWHPKHDDEAMDIIRKAAQHFKDKKEGIW